MPLIVIIGIPCSGKTTRSNALKKFFEEKNRQVHLISENKFLDESKDIIYGNSNKEKMLRGRMKSEVSKFINSTDLVIFDGLNYIKGYRYELYCLAKKYKSQYCLFQCLTPNDEVKEWNAKRCPEEQYSEKVLSELIMRHEAPNSSNRWDSPLYTVLPESPVPFDELNQVLFEQKPPTQNKSTELQPLSSNNYMFELDKNTQELIESIMFAQKMGHTQVKLENIPEPLELNRKIMLSELSKLRRQFIVYSKSHPVKESEKIKGLFMQYLRKNVV